MAVAATMFILVIKSKQSVAHPHTAGDIWTKEEYLFLLYTAAYLKVFPGLKIFNIYPESSSSS